MGVGEVEHTADVAVCWIFLEAAQARALTGQHGAGGGVGAARLQSAG